jgi:alpha-glucosidase (family GH31 glycosyl hydrolase)
MALSVTISAVGCPNATEAVVENDVVKATVSLDPFAIRIEDQRGRLIAESAVNAGGRNGPLVAAVDRWDEKLVLSPGWDNYVEGAQEWRAFTKARVAATGESENAKILDLEVESVDGDVATVRMVLSGDRLVVRALVGGELEGFDTLLSLGFRYSADTRVFGGGERFGPLNHRGSCLYSWAEEGGLGLGEDAPVGPGNPAPNGGSMTYFPVPFFQLRSPAGGHGVFLDTTLRTTACFGAEDEGVQRYTVNGSALDVVFYVNDDPLEVLDRYTEDTGRPMVPAPWVWGPRRRVNPNQRVADYDNQLEHELLRLFKVPTTGIDDSIHLLPHRQELGREDELRAWIDEAHSWGYKVMAYNNPYISATIATAADDLAFGRQNDLFLKDAAGEVGEVFFVSGQSQSLATIDLTNDDGVAWFQSLLRRSLDLGYDGWMHDFGEYVQRGWTAHDGSVGEQLHNRFPVLSAKAAHDLLVAERPDDFLFFVRSGYAGTQAYVPAVWGGDAEASFDESQGIPSAFRSGLNLSMSGVPYWGSDTSGFKCLTDAPRDKEMYLRWAQLSATSPIFLEQNACVGITRQQKWSLWNDDETIDSYADNARLHTRLQPYFMMLAKAANATGAPLLRPAFFEAPSDPESLDVDDAWFLGSGLYVAPVLRRGQTSREVLFPPGGRRAVDLRSGQVHLPGRRRVDAPLLGLPPTFLMEGEILPLLDDEVQTLANSNRDDVIDVNDKADVLDVIVALGDGGDATATLVDGTVIRVARDGAADTPALGVFGDDAEYGARVYGDFAESPGSPLILRGDKARSTSVSKAGVTVSVDGDVERLVRFVIFRL